MNQVTEARGSASNDIQISGCKEIEHSMYGISRISDTVHRSQAWRVSLRRRGRRLVKNFPDKKFGGAHQALKFAMRYRDQLLAQYPPLSQAEFAQASRRNNTSGVTGASLVSSRHRLRSGEERRSFYWEAIWPTSPGQHINKRFSISTHGYDSAFELACQARRLGLRGVEGIYWRSERAVLQNDHSKVTSESSFLRSAIPPDQYPIPDVLMSWQLDQTSHRL
jgi:hypothetical protein